MELIQKIGNLTELKRLDITKFKAVHGPKLYSWALSIGKLNGCPRLAQTFLHFTAGGFPKLNRMRLLELVELSGLRLDKSTLPNIKELNLIRCPEMKSSLQGIEYLTTLQKLHLEEMPEELVQRLRNEESVNRRRSDPSRLCRFGELSCPPQPFELESTVFGLRSLARALAFWPCGLSRIVPP
ncbi:disease resistance protein RPM1-like protein [Tanacetum coccineum]